MSQVVENKIEFSNELKKIDVFDYKTLVVEEHTLVHELNGSPLFNDKSIFFDFGACLGNFTEPMYDKYKGDHYLYEPSPRLFRLLKRRFKDKDNVFIMNLALYKETTIKTLYLGNWVTASSLFPSHRGLGTAKIDVQTTTLDNEFNNFDRIDLMKLDIEGDELEVLQSCKPETLEKINQIVMEYHLQAEINDYTELKVNKCREYLKKYFHEIGTPQDILYINKRLL